MKNSKDKKVDRMQALQRRKLMERRRMVNVTRGFDSYKVSYHGEQRVRHRIVKARIDCFKGKRLVGRILFFNDSAVAPNTIMKMGPSLHYPISRFNDVINILQNEKPLYLKLVGNRRNLMGWLGTSELEPVGIGEEEEEIAEAEVEQEDKEKEEEKAEATQEKEKKE